MRLMENENKAPAKRVFRFDILYFIAVLFAVLLIRDLLVGQNHVKVISYSEFQNLIEKDGVTDVVVGPTQITGAYRQPIEKDAPQRFSTVRVDPQIADVLMRRNISFSGESAPGLFENLLSWLMPAAMFVLIWMFLLRPMMAGSRFGRVMRIENCQMSLLSGRSLFKGT